MKLTKIHLLALSAMAVLAVCFSIPASGATAIEYEFAGTGTLSVPLYSLPADGVLDVPLYSIGWTGRVETNGNRLSGHSAINAVLRPNASTGGYDLIVEADGLAVPLYSFPDVVRGGACLPFPQQPR